MVHEHQQFAYLILFLLILLEGGEITLPIFGALSRERSVDFSVVVMIAFMTTVGCDIVFWWIGRNFSRFHMKRILFIDVGKIKRALEKMKPSVGIFIFFSKFAYGFNRAASAAVGYMNVGLKKLIQYSTLASLVWVLFFTSSGYILADQTKLFYQRIEKTSFIIFASLIVVIFFEVYVKKVINRFIALAEASKDSLSQQDHKDLE